MEQLELIEEQNERSAVARIENGIVRPSFLGRKEQASCVRAGT